jgi:type IV secretory pathway protease TraF
MPGPLLKQVEAIGGDEICRTREPIGNISINGKVVAEVLDKDRQGRPLPAWEGCMRLVEGAYFLLQPHPNSFDSRYFGPVLRCDILGARVHSGHGIPICERLATTGARLK